MTPILGVDWGEKRLGIAVSDPSHTLARPVGTLETRGIRESVALIGAKALELEARVIVIGLPLLSSGDEGESARRVRKLGRSLESKGYEVVFQDERFSTEDARERIKALGKSLESPGILDSVAATLVLQSYLDERQR